MTSIYLPTYVTYDGHYRETTPTDDFGYFTTEEAVKAWVASQNDDRHGYDRYLKLKQNQQKQYDDAYQKAVDQWNRLVETFDDPESFMKEPQRVTTPIYTFEEWSAKQEARYDYVEVELHTEEAAS